MPLLVLLFQLQVAGAVPTAPVTPPTTAPAAPPAATETLTLEQAVGAALAHHPDVVVAGAQTEIARAGARQARAPLLPQLGVTGRYGYQWRDTGDDEFGDGGGSDSFSATASGNLLLWDFGQTRNRWRSALAASDAANQDAETVRQGIVLNARLAFLDALETSQLIQVARETLDNQSSHLSQTEEFVKLGTRPEIDLAKLRTQVAQARAALTRAENDHRTAKARLNRAMGVSGSIEYEVAPTEFPALAEESQTTAHLYNSSRRSERASQVASIRGQEADVRAARTWLLPSLRLGADAGYGGTDFADPIFSTSVGVTLSWNLFDGLASPAAADSARAQLVVQQARLSSVDQQVWQEIEEARIGVASSRAELESAVLAVESARELRRLAEERYTAGVGNSLELSDAQLELANAAAQHVRVQFDVAAARAQLLRALGRRDWR
ncbi:MAG TPA: TolC family protein [Kofleriaceae bacterium]|nr:TolC family protein [Kofleriaceae bacterium]